VLSHARSDLNDVLIVSDGGLCLAARFDREFSAASQV
jgi:hypothetical protein